MHYPSLQSIWLCPLCSQVRLATSDLKVPLRQAQGSASQAAAALAKLAEQQQQLQKQLDGSQELIAALQGLAAKQFKVSYRQQVI